MLVKTMEELSQLSRFSRIFPTPATHSYLSYLGKEHFDITRSYITSRKKFTTAIYVGTGKKYISSENGQHPCPSA